jgi:putative SOS response-associated peptidase YedK
MCGRLTLTTPARVVAEHFDVAEVPLLAPRYNIAPSQTVAVVRQRRSVPERTLEMRVWGLVPAWAAEPSIGARLINARAETVAQKRAYRDAFRQRRCLVAADGFYEWQARGRNPKQPYHVTPQGAELFAIAGLYERWTGSEGSPLDTCTLITTEANERMRPVHGRMPALLPRDAWSAWLDPKGHDVEALQALLCPSPVDSLALQPVGLRVNDTRHDDAECIRPVVGGLFPELF